MIKGTNKNAVIVKGRSELFEQAIFIVRPEASKREISGAEIRREIEIFIRENTGRKRR
ncbi:MAG: hypothetical protein IJD95_06160 [Clostridia bacterium]|nr:hypothetical protein [Clostridia bacterium]MBR2327741.1 hypothetical protein [Clostridia bacterium]